jgi:hypothetical protein
VERHCYTNPTATLLLTETFPFTNEVCKAMRLRAHEPSDGHFVSVTTS